ncbi:copper resistance CopC/CopD family protein [Streptomyces sp. IB201691-2A2]|uniref:copper resistance CopC/CopD family protein n=1 Tax=Streptomyces sp. IB201691-2A2 TaxID=2561920 RepID=UPI0021B14915|nr:copper resistance protein CopC [Streptomyces sp. IB201691-2A2]
MSAPRRAVALVALLGTLFLLGGAGSVSAHSAVRETSPGEGTVLKSAPKQVTMTFTEAVGITDDSLRVLSPENRRVNAGDTEHASGRSDMVRVPLDDGLADGTYTVAWRVVSADSHPISGAFTFSIGKPSETTASVSAEPAVNPASGALYDIARYAAYAAVALLIGAATFVLVCRPPSAEPLRGLVRAGWWVLVASTAALLLIRGPYERGTGPSTLLDPELIENTLISRPGWALLARLALLAGAAVFLVRIVPVVRGASETEGSGTEGPELEGPEEEEVRPKPVVLAVGGLLAVGLAGTWAAAEHASAGIQVPLAMTSSVLHLLAMAVWLGGLAALLTTLHRSEALLSAVSVARFSRLAFASVVVLVLTGVYQSWRGLGSWDALFDTSYGQILVAKVCAVVLLLAAAGFSRRWTGRLTDAEEPLRVPVLETVGAHAGAGGGVDSGPAGGNSGRGAGESPSAAAGDGPEEDPENESEAASAPGARRSALRRSVLAEVVVGVVVLVVTTVLTGTQPGRAEIETAAAEETAAAGQRTASTTLIPFDVGTPGGQGKVQIVLEPGRVGENTVEAVIIGPDGGIATVPEIRLSFTLASQKIGPIDAGLTNKGGYWGTSSLNLPIPGTWTMKVTIRTSDIDQVSETRRVKILR